ncbi:MAG TPA: serine hydrolase domain-containing protein [Hyphomonadaceae bacterium]|jgi:CubicO group peptidase (beta-lactamase class C family)|nr:serine hydrolase domain-containing protein [Hyphomonadaceae bacterium]
MTNKKRQLWGAASAVVLALMVACSPKAEPVAEAPAAPPPPPVADPSVSSIAMAADPATLGFQQAVFDKAKAELEADVKAGIIPGAVLLIAKGGQVVDLAAVGQQGPADPTPMSPETIFRVYSMSKPIVSVAAMQLVEEGKLALTDNVSKYIPEFAKMNVLEGKGKTHPAPREITIRDLMSHESGLIYGFFDQQSELGKQYMAAGDTRFDFTALDLAKAIAALPLESDPGTTWRYSRSTDVLGAVLEIASGQKLDALLQDKIFTPLGMNDTHFYLEADEGSRLAEPPTTLKAPLSTPKVVAPMLSGGGGLNSTTEDYFRFVEMLRGKGEYKGVRIIKPETLDTMLQPQIGTTVNRKNWFYGPLGDFGLGFGLLPIDLKDPAKGNVFSWSGYAGTNMWVDPKNDITMVFMIQNNEASAKYPQKLRDWVYGGYKPSVTSGPAMAPAAPAPAAPAPAPAKEPVH